MGKESTHQMHQIEYQKIFRENIFIKPNDKSKKNTLSIDVLRFIPNHLDMDELKCCTVFSINKLTDILVR